MTALGQHAMVLPFYANWAKVAPREAPSELPQQRPNGSFKLFALLKKTIFGLTDSTHHSAHGS